MDPVAVVHQYTASIWNYDKKINEHENNSSVSHTLVQKYDIMLNVRTFQ